MPCIKRNNEEWGWALLEKDGVGVMPAKPDQQTPFDKPSLTGSFYTHTENVDELWNNLKDKVKIVYDIENFD